MGATQHTIVLGGAHILLGVPSRRSLSSARLGFPEPFVGVFQQSLRDLVLWSKLDRAAEANGGAGIISLREQLPQFTPSVRKMGPQPNRLPKCLQCRCLLAEAVVTIAEFVLLICIVGIQLTRLAVT